ncbi:putative ester cyclase [Sinobaca qinghaiensis]|uniref:Putative ester cyclase n=1 Tax=Sinobaca qinghaiensis TaxID=342944 RepID=A0A419V8Q7_9BACL|nr:ester cyclase [Sinobaca qinghaiensis]RKD76343.1 putative ester cyclase [Sinobaca qinghaiensis]
MESKNTEKAAKKQENTEVEKPNGRPAPASASASAEEPRWAVKNTFPANIVHYADSNDVNAMDSRDDDDYMNHIAKEDVKKQSMKGFGDYNNIIDYIVKITWQIWNEKDIGMIYDTYSYGVQIHRGSVNSHGVNEVISGTMQTLQAFPDRSGVGYSILWSGNDEDGFFTSHRGRSIATNMGDTLYGPATGKRVVFRTVADCLIHENKIYEEWLVMDTYHLVQQLGFDPVEVAKRTAKQTSKLAPSMSFNLTQTAEEGMPPKEYIPKSSSFEIGDFMLEMINKVWERRSFNQVKTFYEKNAVMHYVCNKDMAGHSEIQGTLLNLFASIPNGKVLIDRVTCNKKGSDDDWDVAVRWRIQGLHSGIGYFGYPSGKAIEINGINHYKVRNQKIQEEWFLFDGLEVLRQVYTDHKDDNDGDFSFEDGNFTGVS